MDVYERSLDNFTRNKFQVLLQIKIRDLDLILKLGTTRKGLDRIRWDSKIWNCHRHSAAGGMAASVNKQKTREVINNDKNIFQMEIEVSIYSITKSSSFLVFTLNHQI